jgi:nicotinate-nucleotide adenylyltransferase
VVGADSLLDLPHWYRTAELLARINLIVVKRDTLPAEMMERSLNTLDPSYAYDADLGKWVGETGGTVEYLADVEVPVSSSSIRDELAQGRVPALLSPAVLTYVKRHKLYGWPSSP